MVVLVDIAFAQRSETYLFLFDPREQVGFKFQKSTVIFDTNIGRKSTNRIIHYNNTTGKRMEMLPPGDSAEQDERQAREAIRNRNKQRRLVQAVDFLLTRKMFPEKNFDLQSMKVDMIFVMELPQSKDPEYMDRNKVPLLNELVKTPDVEFREAYTKAFEEIYKSVPQSKPESTEICMKQGIKLNKGSENQEYEAVPQQSVFTLNYNTLIYVLEVFCGFITEKLILDKRIFIFVECPMGELLTAANKYHIRKEVLYSQIDIFLNLPTDSKDRPLLDGETPIPKNRIEENSQQKDKDKLKFKSKFRKLGNVPVKKEVLDPAHRTDGQIQKLDNFLVDYYDLLSGFNELTTPTAYDVNYLVSLLKKRDLHAGHFHIFRQVRNKQEYFARVKEIMHRYGYVTYEGEPTFTDFFTLNKNKTVKERIRAMLLFKPHVSGSEGERQLFLKMERTMLTYLIIQEHLRTENLSKYRIQMMSLHDDFEKSGRSSRPGPVKGGLDGKSLEEQWSVWKPWTVNYKLLRDYLGEKAAFYAVLKTKLILTFLTLIPLCLAAYLLITLYLPTLSQQPTRYFDTQLAIYWVYSAVVVVFFAVFTSSWRMEEKEILETFSPKFTQKTIRPNYKAPYIRNLIYDTVNDFKESRSFGSRVMEFVSMFVMLCILALEAVAFYGIRQLILYWIGTFPKNFIVPWEEFIPYLIYYFSNTILYMLVLRYLFDFLADKENHPDTDSFDRSKSNKHTIFLVSLQIIPSVYLLLVEYLRGNSCDHYACFASFDDFAQSRYIIIFISLVIKFGVLLGQMISISIRNMGAGKFMKKAHFKQIEGDTPEAKWTRKFLRKVYKQYHMSELDSTAYDEVVVLVQFALFSVTQPLSVIINMVNVLLEYYLERMQIMNSLRRPINKQSPLTSISRLVITPLYIYCISTSWMLFVTFEELEGEGGNILMAITFQNPTPSNIFTVKCLFVVVWFLFLLIIHSAVSELYDVLYQGNFMLYRKEKKLKSYLYKFQMQPVGVDPSEVYPTRYLGRVFQQ